ncbi:restriction endonuclease subunit S [Lactobacillus sp. ESL0701]|uniref:restriction endonuclease subunit S n=1 Tax=Lactobacillus sp. ESL0701 TaxID=2983217 RepID=UPI0023F863CE|nr:restriction endonuclease subunit S [Lactobacillus sp. ESL0701]MDF7672919.1 restriction endonuclease subunit S [Lactobacillus sp. ESL0701]
MSKDTNVPRIRFKGFTNAWERDKLKNILSEFNKKSKIENQYKILSSTNSGMEFRNGRVSGNSNTGYKIVKNGDLILSPQNLWLGNINVNNIGVGLVSPSYKTFNFTNIDSSFIEPQLKTKKMLEKYKNVSVQGASVVRRNLDLEAFYQIDLNKPNIDEQLIIGNFFKKIILFITLQERKLELYKQLKKYLLQKMFANEQEKVPQIRFKGFNEDWEQHKLEKLAKFSKGIGYTKNDLKDSGEPIILYGRLYTQYETVIKKVDTFVNKKVNSVVSTGGEVIVPASGETAKDISRASAIGTSGIILAGDLNIIDTGKDISSVFLALNISNGTQQKELSKHAQGKSVVHLHNSDLKKVMLNHPSLNEQQKISSLFLNLDSLITGKNHKLKLYKQLKQYLLQNLFC